MRARYDELLRSGERAVGAVDDLLEVVQDQQQGLAAKEIDKLHALRQVAMKAQPHRFRHGGREGVKVEVARLHA